MRIFLFLSAATFKINIFFMIKYFVIYLNIFFAYLFNDFLYTFISLKSFLFNSALYIPFFFFIYKFILLLIIVYIFLINIEKYYNDDELKLRNFVLLFVLCLFIILVILLDIANK